MLAPRLNAAGRMSSADLALDLLLLRGRDEDVARRARATSPGSCRDENTRRQEQEAAILADAKRLDRRRPGHRRAQHLLIVAGDGWHRGVIGIVASKLVDAYHKPALVLSIDDGIAHGSGRSIAAFDLLAALEACARRVPAVRRPSAGRRRHARSRAHSASCAGG